MRHLVERETSQLTDTELLDLYDGCAGTEQRADLREELRRRINRPHATTLQHHQGALGGLGIGLGQGGQGNG